ncbi:uncharacterized protein LOC129949607 [Eupeodes corollae]|uniref:uncharacterized protein LOC129949607 n=1 Tax=Eupeodes corollae TaxID=290404 RepID=UPI002491BF4A|nr:uncharacterized protein LOC129949607 [Eupeodes corollae]
MALAMCISVDYYAIQAPRNKCEIPIEGVGNCLSTYARGRATVQLSSNFNQHFGMSVEVYLIEAITSPTPVSKISDDCWQHLRNLQLADPSFGTTGRIDALLGADVWGQLITNGIVRGSNTEPFAQSTQLGWVVFGPATLQSHTVPTVRSLATCTKHDLRVDEWLRILFEADNEHTTSTTTMEADLCEHIFMSTHTRDLDGRYIVQIPFKLNASALGNSHNLALRQFYQLERRLTSNPDLREKYINFLREYIQLGHMTAISDRPGEPAQSYYVPHHAVTMKFRVVFNASAQTSTGISLNDTQLAGPLIQELLVNIIHRFRRFAVALSADVEKMFRQVLIDKRHRQWQQILWRESPTELLRTYQLNTVTYGTASGPYLAVRAMQQCALDNSCILPTNERAKAAQESILRDFYIDDYLCSAPSTKAAVLLARDVDSVLKEGHFCLRKWRSNDSRVLAKLTNTPFTDEIELQAMETTVLGLNWDPIADELFYKVKLATDTTSTTKRQVLSDTARLYDPLGMLAPVIIVAKLFIQRLWLAGLAWDTPLPTDLLDEWLTFRGDLQRLEKIRIPRWIGIQIDATLQLHGFCDASMKAYAAVIYLITVDNKGYRKSILITSKTKVAPSKAVTIPRLELCAAQLLTTTMITTRQALDLNNIPYTMWSDSSIVLYWLRKSTTQLKPYVANRVGYIQQNSEIGNWNHIRTRFNPADCASRGISVDALISHPLWWHGPTIDIEQSSVEGTTLTENESLEMETELKPIKAHMACALKRLSIETWYRRGTETIIIPLLDRFSKLGKLLRTTAYILRWRKSNRIYRSQFFVTAEEIEEALRWHTKAVQHTFFAAEIIQLQKGNSVGGSSKLASLTPYMDKEMNNILRVSGRLDNANLGGSRTHPIILPRESTLAKLIVQKTHDETLHGGIQLMIQTIREKYWILHVRILVKHVIHFCSICRRHRHTMAKQRMASLPSARVLASPPFSISGVDYFGPYNIRIGSKNVRTVKKTYAAVFVCLASKAVHIELAEDLSAEAFINLFTRFVNRRGPCHQLFSDNGTAFVGANRLLQEDLKEWQGAYALQHLANRGTQWHFITPSAPHQGGLWEAAVKSAKKHLRRVIGTQSIYYDQLHTLLVHIEACLNSRPLVALHDDIDDRLALTPADFLIGRSIIAVPDKPVLEVPTQRLSYWRQLRQMQQHFWRRWQDEYLQTLQPRSKWHEATENINIGDVVIIKNENLPATQWPLGRIMKLHPGKDGLTRVVTIKHQKGECLRPIQKLCKILDDSERTRPAGQDVRDFKDEGASPLATEK